MLTRNKKDLAKSLLREVLRFSHNLIDRKCDAQDRIIARETAILTIVDAFVREIQRCKEAHRSPKVLQRERAGSSRHAFQFLRRFWRNQMLKALDQLRLSQREAVQCFDERHHHNFVGMIRFANLASKKRAASAIADTAIQMLRANGSEREIHAGADHTK